MTCLDCGLDICVLKEIELTSGCVSMQWAPWTLSPPSYQPSPRLSPVMLPGHFVSVFMSRSGQEWHGHKDILNTCLRKPERSIRVQLFCMQTWAFFFFFPSWFLTVVHLITLDFSSLAFKATSIPLSSHLSTHLTVGLFISCFCSLIVSLSPALCLLPPACLWLIFSTVLFLIFFPPFLFHARL